MLRPPSAVTASAVSSIVPGMRARPDSSMMLPYEVGASVRVLRPVT